MFLKEFIEKSAVAATVFTILVGLVAIPVNAQKISDSEAQPEIRTVEAAPSPIYFSGNPTCGNLNASGNPALAHITENWGLKFDFAPPAGPSGPYAFQNAGSVLLQGGAPAEPSNSISITRTGSQLSWSSTRPITAVIVKGAAEANVYPYNPASFGGPSNGTGLITPTGTNNYNHHVFCPENFLIPRSAPAPGMGSVINLNGRGMGGVTITATNELTGEVKRVNTTSFGYYKIEELEIGTLYTVRVASKRHQFFDAERTLVIEDNMQGFDFVGIQ